MTERETLLRQVQAYGFTLVEANLYLDGHPNCQKALNYFYQQRELYDQARSAYESKYGPLMASSNEDPECWRWIDNPWPWEMEGN
jgi:spore coat protein JB